MVVNSFECLIAINDSYVITVVNNAMKREAKHILGKDVSEGMNLKEVFHDKPSCIAVWTSSLQGHPQKKIFSNTLKGVTYKMSCYPLLDKAGNLIGAFATFKPSMKGDIYGFDPGKETSISD